jgi:hypothetical protein
MGRRAAGAGDLIEISSGPYRGVFDSPDPKEARSTRLFDALNMLIPDLINGSEVVARHGMVGSTTRLGSGTDYTGQGVWLHRRLDSTIDRFTFGGGKMYRWDGATTFTDITPAGIKIDTVNPIFCASYSGKVVVSDEQNKPWVYDPILATAAVIEMNANLDEWATKGGPEVYGGKVFFILRALGMATLDTESALDIITEDGVTLTTELTSGYQNSIVWSEELTPDIGYQQLNYDNLWQLTQTSNEVLGGIEAEEGALIYFRNQGIGYISGVVTTNFRASATKDTISTTIGTDAPAAIVSVNRHVFFVDMDGRVFRAIVGAGEPQQLWFPVRREIEEHVGTSASRSNVVSYARGAYHPGYNLVLFTIWDRQTIYAFDADSGTFEGTWSIGGDINAGIHIDAMGSLIDSSNRSCFVVMGSRTSTRDSTTQGVLWRQKQADDTVQWLEQPDEAVASYTALIRAVETHWLTSSAAKSYRVTDVAAELLGHSARHAVKLQYIVPSSGRSNAITAQSSAATGEKSATDTISVARWSLGPNAQGTSVRLRVSADHSDNVRFGVSDLSLKAAITQARIGGK